MREMIFAKVTTTDAGGLLPCHGARAGDMVAQAMAWSNGDNVTGVFLPVIPGTDVIVQAKPAPGIECLILLHRFRADG